MRLTLHQGSGPFVTYAEMSAWFRTTDYIVVLHRLKRAHPNNGAVRLIPLPLVFARFEPLSPFDLILDEKEQALDNRSCDFWLLSPAVRVRGGCCTGVDETPSTVEWIGAFVVRNHWNQNVFLQNAYWGGERRASGSS